MNIKTLIEMVTTVVVQIPTLSLRHLLSKAIFPSLANIQDLAQLR